MEWPECPVCLEIYDGGAAVPRVLSCGHSACEQCLRRLPRHHNSHTIKCPSCTHLVPYPHPHGAAALPKNIDLLRLAAAAAAPAPAPAPLPSSSPAKDLYHDHLVLLPPLWSSDLYSIWKHWIIPSQSISPSRFDPKLGLGLGFFSVLQGRVNSPGGFDPPRSCFREGQTVSLIQVASISPRTDVDDFVYGDAVRVVEFLRSMSVDEREELGFIIRGCYRKNRLCMCYGLWYDEEERSVYLVFERYVVGFLDRFGGDYAENKQENDPISTGRVCSELCEAVLDLHHEGVTAGCFGCSCFSHDRYDHVYLDYSGIISTVRTARFCFMEFFAGEIMVDSSSIDAILTKMLENRVFLSPEVFIQLVRQEGGNIHSYAYSFDSIGKCSDSWSLACLVLHLFLQKSFTEELLAYMKRVLEMKNDESKTSCVDFIDISPIWEGRFGSKYGGLKDVLRDCLRVDCDRRPSIASIWKCARGSTVELEEYVGMCHCVSFGRICRFSQKELGKEMGDMYATGVGARGNICEDIFDNGKVKVKDLNGHCSSITGLTIGGGFLFSSSLDKTIGLWSLESFSLVHSFKGHEYHVMALTFVDDEKRPFCVSGDKGGGIFMWDVSPPFADGPIRTWNEEKDWRYSGIQTLVVYDSRYLYTGGGDTTVKAWSLQDYELYCTMAGHKSTVSGLSISGGVLYSGSWDGTVRLWSLHDHGLLAVLGEEGPRNPLFVTRVVSGGGSVVAAYNSGGVKIWRDDVETAVRAHTGPITSSVLDGRLLLTAGLDRTLNTLELGGDEYNVETVHIGSVLYNSAVTALFSYQGVYLCVGLEDGVIKVYCNSH